MMITQISESKKQKAEGRRQKAEGRRQKNPLPDLSLLGYY
jgi:hypothetical protein